MSQSIKDVQNKILETMKYIDELCEKYNITYYIMGGTALGAVRHGGFIPWDDDLDIFMTIDNYEKFKYAFSKEKSNNFVLRINGVEKVSLLGVYILLVIIFIGYVVYLFKKKSNKNNS